MIFLFPSSFSDFFLLPEEERPKPKYVFNSFVDVLFISKEIFKYMFEFLVIILIY